MACQRLPLSHSSTRNFELKNKSTAGKTDGKEDEYSGA